MDQYFPSVFSSVDHYFPGIGGSIFFWRVDHYFLDKRNPGGIYHLIQRGNNREFIFDKAEDKEYLLGLLKTYKQRMGFQLFGYVVMGNHYHLVLKVLNAPLQDIMHRINNQFSRNYNKKNKRTGHVFENRYKGILVIDDRYLLSLLRYVHQNPINAKICRKIEDYSWSSDKFYRNNLLDGVVDIDHILDIFSKNREAALKTYKNFMDENELEKINVFENVDVIGKVNTKQLDEYLNSDVKTLDQILREIAGDEKIFKAIKNGSRKRHLRIYKKEYVGEAMEFNYTMKEIGECISISDAAVFKIINAD